MMIRFLVIALAIITTTVNAQNEVDALRYSTQNISGTARYSSMGGAFGSLGGEFSSLKFQSCWNWNVSTRRTHFYTFHTF